MLSVLIPYRPDGGHRDRIWAWLAERYRQMLPDVEVIVEADDGGSSPGQFNHPLAINRAAERSSGNVLMIADCDTAFDPDWVNEAHRQVALGEAAWVLPKQYVKVHEMWSDWLLDQPADTPLTSRTEVSAEWIGDSVSWSGLVVVPRSAFELTGGYDERFAWWGADDVAFGLTMDALHGRHTRLAGAAFHLWHPQPPSDTYQSPGYAANAALTERYKAAALDADEIRKVRFS